jgi:WD40 repeat protein
MRPLWYSIASPAHYCLTKAHFFPRMNSRHFSFVLASISFSAVGFAQSPKPKIVEQIVGPAYVQGTIYTLSPKGMRLATMHAKDGKFVVTIDGVEGEAFDQILLTAPTFDTHYDPAGVIAQQSVSRRGPVALSPDGKRFAYAGLRGTDVVLILDGKEIFRAPHSVAAPPVSLLQFTPDGKHVYFYNQTSDTMQSFRLMMDGKAVTPAFDGTPQPHFSADGSRWLLSAGKAKQPTERFLIIDGKDAGYSGQRVRFSPDGKHVVCAAGPERDQKLLVDGKPLMTAPFIERFKISATNDVAVIVRPSSGTGDVFKQTLYLNGKLVPGSEGVADVWFSPDGKHWAARLQRDMATVVWVMHDGKKHKDYASVSDITFSPDSSTLAYIAGNGTKRFVVANGKEDEGNDLTRSRPTFAQTGNKFIYAAGQQALALKIYFNGKASPVHRNVFRLAFSPNGERYAYFAGLDGNTTEFIVDGETVTRDGAFGGTAFFSPDSKHLAATTRKPQGYGTVYYDGAFLPERLAVATPKEFTPDSQHLISVGTDTQSGNVRYYLDGDLVAEFSGRAMPWENSPKMKREATSGAVLPFGVSSVTPDPDAKPWEYMSDGTIVFIGPALDPTGSGPMKKVSVTPTAGTSVATWFASAKAAEEKALADAADAKIKAEAEKAAAAAKAKADAEAAAAKRKADYDEALAAKTKARQEALDARAKAAADAAAKRAKK